MLAVHPPMRTASSIAFILGAAFGLATIATPGSAAIEAAAAETPVPPSAPGLACYEAGQEQTVLDEQEIRRLCQGSSTTGPVVCYQASTERTVLDERRGIDLCRCALGEEPVDCFEDAVARVEVSEREALRMCRARTLRNVLLPNCETI